MDSVKTDAKWKLVPELPTREMFIAAFDALVPAADAAACWAAMLAASPPAGAEVRVKPLVWEETHTRRSNEDPATEITGFESETAFGTFYVIEVGAALFHLRYDYTSLGEFETEREAKAAGDVHNANRILSALEPTPSTDAVRRLAREEALEEAARACEDLAERVFHPTQVITDRCATAIRALSTPPAGAAALNEGEG